jgi:hypothetical protein
MNAIALKEELGLIVEGHLKPINDGQKALLRLICEKYKNNEPLQKEEAKQIYIEKVKRKIGITYTYRLGDSPWETKTYPYKDWELDQLTISWMLRALGALIQKGYLTVIPRIQLQ